MLYIEQVVNSAVKCHFFLGGGGGGGGGGEGTAKRCKRLNTGDHTTHDGLFPILEVNVLDVTRSEN